MRVFTVVHFILHFISVYTEFEDMHSALLNEEVEGVFMERLQAYYFYKDKADLYDEDNLRVFHTVPAEISYKMALKHNTTCKFLEKNYCFRRRLEYPLIDSLVKIYTTPLKVLFCVISYVSPGLLCFKGPF